MQNISKKVKRLQVSVFPSLSVSPSHIHTYTQQRANKLKEVREARDVQRRKDYERKLQHEKMLEARPAK